MVGMVIVPGAGHVDVLTKLTVDVPIIVDTNVTVDIGGQEELDV